MKVIHITSSYPRFLEDGTAPFIRSIVEEQLELGYEVFVLAPYDPDVNKQHQEQFVTRFRYIRPDSLHIMGHAKALTAGVYLRPLAILLAPLYLLFGLYRLFRIASSEKPDILHAHWVLPNGPIAAIVSYMLGIPLTISLHGSDVFIANKSTLLKTIARLSLNQAKIITAPSNDLKKRAMDTGTKNPILVAPWGVNPKLFKYEQTHEDPSRYKELGSLQHTIISLGRMDYKKGFRYLVESMPAILERFPNTHFLIGGEGPIREELRQCAEDLNVSEYLELPGKIPWDDVPEFLGKGDIFVLPSVQDEHGNVDGLPTVMFEAMSTGLPVVASDIGGIGLVINDYDNGIKVPPGDIQALQKAIEYLLENSEEAVQIGRRAREEIEARFTWKHVAQYLDSLYRQTTQ